MKKIVIKPLKLSIGNKVRFYNSITNEWIEDTIKYFDKKVIEGEIYDLTYINFEIIN